MVTLSTDRTDTALFQDLIPKTQYMAQISLGFMEPSLATNSVIAKDDLALLTLRPPFLSVAFPRCIPPHPAYPGE